MDEQKLLRPPVEVRYREELEALRATDKGEKAGKLAAVSQSGENFYTGQQDSHRVSGRQRHRRQEILR